MGRRPETRDMTRPDGKVVAARAASLATATFATTCLATACLAVLASAPTALAHGSRYPILKEDSKIIRSHTVKPDDPSELGGPFTMTDHTGRVVTDQTFHGQWSLFFFGYTGCREACPLGLEHITQALQLMGTDGDRIQPVFIDVGMEPPDKKGLAQFVSNFHPRLLGLAGTRAQTYEIVRHYKIRREYMATNYSKKEFGPRIDHTTYIFMVDPQGRTRGYFHHALPPDQMVTFIRKHL